MIYDTNIFSSFLRQKDGASDKRSLRLWDCKRMSDNGHCSVRSWPPTLSQLLIQSRPLIQSRFLTERSVKLKIVGEQISEETELTSDIEDDVYHQKLKHLTMFEANYKSDLYVKALLQFSSFMLSDPAEQASKKLMITEKLILEEIEMTSDNPVQGTGNVSTHGDDEMFVAGCMPNPQAICPDQSLLPEAWNSAPQEHPDTFALRSLLLVENGVTKCGVDMQEKGFATWKVCDITISNDKIEPDWFMKTDDEAFQLSLELCAGSGTADSKRYTHVAYRTIVEIFSISIHWNEKENMGGMCYHLYGNVFTFDGNEYGLEAMKRPSLHPLIVSNGDNLPLCGLGRCLVCEPNVWVFVCLIGHKFDSVDCCLDCANSCKKENKVLIKKDLMLHKEPFSVKEGFDNPVEREFAGTDGYHFFKIHYSVMHKSCMVEVEVRLVCPDIEQRSHRINRISIEGQLSVYWHEFKKRVDQLGKRLCDYRIMLFDTKQSDSSLSKSTTVRLGECFPTQRHKLAVPMGYTLVFEADIHTDKGDIFIGQRMIHVVNGETIFTCTFEGSIFNLQVTLYSYYR